MPCELEHRLGEIRLRNSKQGKLGTEKLTDRRSDSTMVIGDCGYEPKTGSAGGWTRAWDSAATEISGKGLEAPGRSTDYERCGFCGQELEGSVTLEKGGICNKNYITHCRHWHGEAKRDNRRE